VIKRNIIILIFGIFISSCSILKKKDKLKSEYKFLDEYEIENHISQGLLFQYDVDEININLDTIFDLQKEYLGSLARLVKSNPEYYNIGIASVSSDYLEKPKNIDISIKRAKLIERFFMDSLGMDHKTIQISGTDAFPRTYRTSKIKDYHRFASVILLKKGYSDMLYHGDFKDTDNDGILNNEDSCPEIYGIKENLGCPKMKAHNTEYDCIYKVIPRVYFDREKFELTEEGKKKYKPFLENILNAYPNATFLLAGNSTQNPKKETNVGYGYLMANYLRAYFIGSLKIEENRIINRTISNMPECDCVEIRVYAYE